MKGVIFNLLEAYINKLGGEDRFDEIVESCTLKTTEPFVGPGTYPDEDILAIITKASEEFKTPLPEFLQEWGKFCIPQLYKKFPRFFDDSKTAKEFLLTIGNIHHTEVVKLYRDAVTPFFEYDDPGTPDRLTMCYKSKRKLCQFMRGLIEGVAGHYKTTIRYEEKSCMLKGDEMCEFVLSFREA